MPTRRHRGRGLNPHIRDTLEEGVPTHCGILAWEIPQTEKPAGLQSTGSQKSRTRLNAEHTRAGAPGGDAPHLPPTSLTQASTGGISSELAPGEGRSSSEEQVCLPSAGPWGTQQTTSVP